MSTNFSSKDKKLSDIMENIDKDLIQLPDFQRGWVWTDSKIKSLLSSICQSYPIGVVMELEYDSKSTGFKNRSFHAEETNVIPSYLILDGQQRLTSIYRAVFSRKPVETIERGELSRQFYYLDIKKALENIQDVEDAIITVPEDKIQRTNFNRDVELDLSSPEKEYAQHKFPMNIMFDRIACSRWRNDYQKYHNYDPDCLEDYTQFETSIIETVYAYQIPVLTITKDMSRGAVCQIFEKVNTGGVVLNVFELLTAIYASESYHLRDTWSQVSKELSEASPLLEDVDNTDFLTAVTLVTRYDSFESGKGVVSCKRSDILKMSLAEFQKRVNDVKEGFKKAALLLDEFHIISKNDIPYKSQLIPLSSILTILGKRANEIPIKKKISSWYWCGVFGELYGGSNDTRYVNDLVGVVGWINGGEEPDTVKRSFFSSTRLLTIKSRNSAAYKGVVALIVANGAKDPMTGTTITLQNYYSLSIDIHHIFPKKYCISQEYPEKKYDCVVNKTPISRRTNEIIGSKAPSNYLVKLEKEKLIEANDLDEIFRGHLANPELMRQDNFDEFIADRATEIINKIEEATGKIVSDKTSQETIDAFGRELVKDKNNE